MVLQDLYGRGVARSAKRRERADHEHNLIEA